MRFAYYCASPAPRERLGHHYRILCEMTALNNNIHFIDRCDSSTHKHSNRRRFRRKVSFSFRLQTGDLQLHTHTHTHTILL